MEYRKAIIHQCVDGEERDTEVWLPIFADDQEVEPIGFWGREHLRYIKRYRRSLYTSLLTGGELHSYLADIDREADELMERTVQAMAQADGTDEALKARDMMKWVGRMNNYRSCAREIVRAQVIYA